MTKQGRENTQGSLYNIRMRVVCARCNNGWMNTLETDARPHLTPLITGERVTLDRAALDIVAKWITLKIMVAEHAEDDLAVTPRSDRMSFRDHGIIPPYFRIYVASHALPFEKSVGYFRNSRSLAIRREGENSPKNLSEIISRSLQDEPPKFSPPLGDVSNNIQTVTFFLGMVFVHATAARVDGFEIENMVRMPTLYDTARIWPPAGGGMDWPREPAFNLKQVDSIAGSMETGFRAQNLFWVSEAPEQETSAFPGGTE